MAEDYNSPQSVYWCLKTLIAIGLSEDDEFWTCPEAPYPTPIQYVETVPAPEQILCNHPDSNHHFMLSPGQFVAWPMKANQAKYCKFAYSSAFAFSVPTGPLIEQIAPDSTIAFSRDGAETWAVKWKCEPVDFGIIRIAREEYATQTPPLAHVKWLPWSDGAVTVETVLIPPTNLFPDWHLRVHRIVTHTDLDTLHTVEGGFAISGRQKKNGRALPMLTQIPENAQPGSFEGVIQGERSTLIASSAGVSGICTQVALTSHNTQVRSKVLKPDSNTNLACPRTLIPVSTSDMFRIPAGTEVVLIQSVFAISSTANGGRQLGGKSLRERWLELPDIDMGSLNSWFMHG